MIAKITLAVVVAMAAIVSIPSSSYAASHRHKAPPSGETGYTNPSGCLGGACTGENPDRVRQPCSGGSCYKHTRSTKHHKHHKSSGLIFEVIRVG
jgi:hypothetical protein